MAAEPSFMELTVFVLYFAPKPYYTIQTNVCLFDFCLFSESGLPSSPTVRVAKHQTGGARCT